MADTPRRRSLLMPQTPHPAPESALPAEDEPVEAAEDDEVLVAFDPNDFEWEDDEDEVGEPVGLSLRTVGLEPLDVIERVAPGAHFTGEAAEDSMVMEDDFGAWEEGGLLVDTLDTPIPGLARARSRRRVPVLGALLVLGPGAVVLATTALVALAMVVGVGLALWSGSQQAPTVADVPAVVAPRVVAVPAPPPPAPEPIEDVFVGPEFVETPEQVAVVKRRRRAAAPVELPPEPEPVAVAEPEPEPEPEPVVTEVPEKVKKGLFRKKNRKNKGR